MPTQLRLGAVCSGGSPCLTDWQYVEHSTVDHGLTFQSWSELLEIGQYCERYADSTYWVVCEECESRDPRYRRSKVVKQPERYFCGRCGSEIDIEPV